MLARLIARVACLLGSHNWLPDPHNAGFRCIDCGKPRRT